MRKLLVLPVIMAFCIADSGAFAATPRAGGRSNSARAATTTNAKTTNVKAKTTGGVAARAAKKTTAGGKVTTTGNKTTGGKKANGARAAATQKVLNMGTKVKGATENTVVDEECQNAYYGCMDAFCMLDNASGGRCQCSDRNKELDVVLEEIMKLDQQTLAMATEGVERIQMGENADEIMARVKAATGGIEGSDTGIDIKGGKKTSNGTKTRTLDLSAWKNNSIFSEDDDVFGETDADVAAGVTAGGEFANKFGDELQVAASGVCVKQLPTQCKDSASFLQLTYGQRIRSDCTAYENSLKQQRNASQEKLATAQKALRDAALESFQNENKYDFGECVVRFKQCLQTTAECGEDYSGCVADTSILQGLYGKKTGGKVATTVIKTGATTITISDATFDIFNNKKMMCTSVVKQCVNANKKDAVWQQVIKDLAPVIYTAEYNAASNSRMNCISTVASCVQKACGSQWDDKSDNYDACLSDSNSINNYCKLEYNRCSDSDSLENVKSYVMAKLAALKVDKCTTDVKECLLSEDRCGPDYTGCIGLDSDSIVDLCSEDTLISCQDRAKGGAAAVREYISQIAQGIALNIDNKFATACQNAVDAAYERVCGGTLSYNSADEDSDVDEVCPNLMLSNNEFKGSLKWQYCKVDSDGNTTDCHDDLSYFGYDDIVANNSVSPEIIGQMSELSDLRYSRNGVCSAATPTSTEEEEVTGESSPSTQTSGTSYFCVGDGSELTNAGLKKLLETMNRDYNMIMERLATDATVKNCREGRTLQGISTRKKNDKGKAETIGREEGRFANILNTAESEISTKIMNSVLSEYYNEIAAMRTSSKAEEMYNTLSQTRRKMIADKLVHDLLGGNKTVCDLSNDEWSNLMQNEEAQKVLKNEQDKINSEACTAIKADPSFPVRNTDYRKWWAVIPVEPVVGGLVKRILTSTIGDTKDVDGHFDYKVRSTYDEATNTCTSKTWTFTCKENGSLRKNRNICRKWNTSESSATVTETKEVLPKWNDKDSTFFKNGCK